MTFAAAAARTAPRPRRMQHVTTAGSALAVALVPLVVGVLVAKGMAADPHTPVNALITGGGQRAGLPRAEWRRAATPRCTGCAPPARARPGAAPPSAPAAPPPSSASRPRVHRGGDDIEGGTRGPAQQAGEIAPGGAHEAVIASRAPARVPGSKGTGVPAASVRSRASTPRSRPASSTS